MLKPFCFINTNLRKIHIHIILLKKIFAYVRLLVLNIKLN